MVYLDYSATTPVNKEVLDSFNKTCTSFIGNSNSLHKLGVEAKKLEEQATKQISELLNVHDFDIIYTSGSSESNNTVIKGICEKYQNRGKKIITTNLEHSSIYGPLGHLQKKGFDVEIVNTLDDGTVDIEHLKTLMDDEVILVTVASVNSETGLLQPIDIIGKVVKEYSKCYFHVDMTQSIGKINVSFDNIDLVSFSAHKFYGIKGIGVLLKRKNIVIEPLIHGGKSTTVYRSGTPALSLIVSLSKALRLSITNLENNQKYVKKYHDIIIEKLSKYNHVHINSNDRCIPHIINFSVDFVKPETLQHALEEHDIYISTQSACSSGHSISKAVLELTKNEEYASHSVRVSLSHLTTEQEVNQFLKAFDICYKRFNNLYEV